MKRLLCIVILVLASQWGLAQEKIVTVSGEEYLGKLLDNKADTVFMRTMPDSLVVAFPKSRIRAIYYDAGDPSRGQYWSAGATVGTPALVQLVGSYDNLHYGVRLSAGYLGPVYGAQVDLYRKLSRSEDFSHEISMIAGYSYTEGRQQDFFFGGSYWYSREWLYVGGAYAIHLSGFFAELGLTIGEGSYSNPQLMIQLGYLYEFR